MAMMTVRIESINTELLDTFRDETAEGLDQLEARLLELVGRRDPALIDHLFRIVHTIKGGAGTFGMTAMSRLAHGMEAVLDAYRRGAEPTSAQVTTLLENTDVLRRLLVGGPSAEREDRALDALLAIPGQLAAPRPADAPSPEADVRHAIRVSPSVDLFRAGIDPVLVFDQLSMLGTLSATVDATALPPLEDLDPTSCHLRWTLDLEGGSAEMVHALFAWFDDLCTIAIETVDAAPLRPAPAPANSSAPALATPAPGPEPRAPAPEPRAPAPEPRAPAPAAARTDATAAVPGSSAPSPRGPDPTARDAGAGGSIRVRLDKLDALIGLIGDLTMAQATLSSLDAGGRIAVDPVRRRSALDDLQRVTRLLQQSALQLRSMPISTVLHRFPRLVHDLGERLGKEIELEVIGEAVEIDKIVLERIGDPLVHLLRNSVDHGIERPDERLAAGKPRAGRIRITVQQHSDEVVIEIADDGRGLDTARILDRARQRGLLAPDRTPSEDELQRMIFLPGFSTAEEVSEVSGRGVGMDVVARTIHELGGDLQLRSTRGAGSTIALRLPLTLAIMDGQHVAFGGRPWIVPLNHVVACDRFDPAAVTMLIGQRPLYRVGDAVIPLLDPCEHLAIRGVEGRKLVLIVETDGQQRALVIDEIGPRQQVVLKSLSAQLARVDGLAGAAILGDGRMAFILDVAGLCTNDGERRTARTT